MKLRPALPAAFLAAFFCGVQFTLPGSLGERFGVAGLTGPLPAMAAETPLFSEEQKAAIADVVADYIAHNPGFIRDYLVANPEVLREAIEALQAKEQAQQVAAQSELIGQHYDQIFNSPNQVVLGNPEGDVTLVEFFDYNCSFCKRALADMETLIKDDPNLKVVLKEFPVLGPGSVEAAQVAVAVHLIAPDKYNDFHQRLLGGHGQASAERAIAVAAEVGLDEAEVRARMKDPAVEATINEVYGIANALGLTGTPTYILPGEVVVGAVGYETLRDKIASVRDCGTATC